MESAINGVLKSHGGLLAMLMSIFANRIAPKLPPRLYRIIDHPFVQVSSVTFLLNAQLQKPALAFSIAAIAIYAIKMVVAAYAPETPPLSGLAKPTTAPPSKGNDKGGPSGNGQVCPPCICNSVVHMV